MTGATMRWVPFLGMVAALHGCSACAGVDEADLFVRRDAGTPGTDSGPMVRPDAGERRDAGGGGGLGDPNDCGGRTCDHLEACIDGVCACRSGRVRDGDRCVDPSSDPDNCGAIGHECESDQVCAGGRCESACPDGTMRCDDSCARTSIDVEHCGECGRRCDRSEYCRAGDCRPYQGGVGCVACPCPSCTGDFSTCCGVAGAPGLVACIADDRCPGM